MREIAKKIALNMYPEYWIYCQFQGEFKHDNNANIRLVAEDVILNILTVIRSQDAAVDVLNAFFRREHNKEANESEVSDLSVKMSVSLMSIDSLLINHNFD